MNQPKTKIELKLLIKNAIRTNGNRCDLNQIDTSLITDMSGLFHNSLFDGDISQWDVSNVETMQSMFESSVFNGDISKWDTSNLAHAYGMFEKSMFLGDLKPWNLSRDFLVNMFDTYYDGKGLFDRYLKERELTEQHKALSSTFRNEHDQKKRVKVL